MIPPHAQITVRGRIIVYRVAAGRGVQVIQVSCEGSEPRVLAWTESISPRGIESSPMSLTLTEILLYIHDALRRTGATPANNVLVAAFEVLATQWGAPPPR